MAKRMQGNEPDPQPPAEPVAPEDSGLDLAALGVADNVGPDMRPRIDPRPAFVYLFHHERWFVMEGLLIPQLATMPLQPGVAGVRSRGAKVSLADALNNKKKRGWVLLDPMIDGKSYLHQPVPGVFLSRWETANAGSEIISTDGPGYARWVRSLVESGKISRPKAYVLQRLRDRLQALVLTYQDQVRTVPSVQPVLERAQADLAAVVAEMGSATLTPLKQIPAGLAGIVE